MFCIPVNILLLQERYRLQKLIGKGGYCQTFLTLDQAQFPPLPCVIQKFSHHHQISEAFLEKTQKLAELSKHPQIPTLIASFSENDYDYWVQEFIPGHNLANLVEQQGIWSETEIWELLTNLLPVLKFIHEHHFIHRDIKPANIIRISSPENKNHFVLVDFATAKLVTTINPFTDESAIGSPEYIAPEQTRGQATFASDLYSLGVTCIYLLTQVPPFDLFDVTNNTWIWENYLHTKVSQKLVQILNKLLQNDLKQRFTSADETITAINLVHSYPRPSVYMSDSQSSIPSPWRCLYTLISNSSISSSINCLSISPDGHTLATGEDNHLIKLWNLNTKKIISSLQGHTQAIKSVAFSPDGNILATASDDQTIKLWNLNSGQEISTLLGHTQSVKSVVFSSDGNILVSGSADKTVKIWDVNTGQEISTLTGHQLQINAVAISPDSRIIASTSSDRTIRIWEQNGSCYSLLTVLCDHTWAVLTVAFSPNGQILATGSDDNTIKLWNVHTGQLISTLLGHSWAVTAVTFTTDGETLISASWDKTVKLWSVSTAKEITTLSGHVDSVLAIAISPVAQLIVSGSRDKSIKLWQLVEQQKI